MKKRILKQEFLFHGFQQTDKKLFVKKFDDIELSIGLDANLFGTVYMINIYYNFKTELPFNEELLSGIWKQSEVSMNDSGTGLIIGALDTRWICGVIQDSAILKDIHMDSINKYCEQFIQAIKPIIEKNNI